MVHSPLVGLVWHSRQSSLRLPRQMEHVSLSTSHDHMNTGLHFLISNGDLPDGFGASAGAVVSAPATGAASGAAAGASVIALGSVIVATETEKEKETTTTGKEKKRETAQSVTPHNALSFFRSHLLPSVLFLSRVHAEADTLRQVPFGWGEHKERKRVRRRTRVEVMHSPRRRTPAAGRAGWRRGVRARRPTRAAAARAACVRQPPCAAAGQSPRRPRRRRRGARR